MEWVIVGIPRPFGVTIPGILGGFEGMAGRVEWVGWGRTYLPATTLGALEQYCARGSIDEEVSVGCAKNWSARAARTGGRRTNMLGATMSQMKVQGT